MAALSGVDASIPESPSYDAEGQPVLAADVNADRYVAPADALAIINYLNANGPGPAPAPPTAGPLYLDTTQDNLITAEDVLLVVNYLNEFSWREGPDVSDDAIVCYAANPADYPWFNSFFPEDVTGERDITTEDALAIIDYLDENGPGPVPASATAGPLYLDVTADNQITVEDLYQVINSTAERLSGMGIVWQRLYYHPPIDTANLQPVLVEEGSEPPGIHIDLYKIHQMSIPEIFQEYPGLEAKIYPEGAIADTLRELVTDRRPAPEFVDPLMALQKWNAQGSEPPSGGWWGFWY